MEVRISQAWNALNKMDKIWKSNMQDQLKVNSFCATVESVHLYGAESWTLTAKMNDRLVGNYTKMLKRPHCEDLRSHL